MDLRTPKERNEQAFRADKRDRVISLLASVASGATLEGCALRIRQQFEIEDCERLTAAIANLKRLRSQVPVDQRRTAAAEQEVAWASLGLPVSLEV